MFHLVVAPNLVAPLALSTFSASIACGLLLARHAGRHTRQTARERALEFASSMDELLAGRLRGRDLLRTAGRLDPEVFWDQAASRLASLPRRARRDLEQCLERSRHVAAERRALRDDSPWRREQAARRLAWLGARRYRRALRRALVAGPELVTLAAATALGHGRDGAALHWLLEHPAAIGHRSPRARMALLRAFGPRALPILERALGRGLSDPGMERAVIDTLVEGGATSAADTIAARLAHEWRDVRVAAARGLGRLESAPHASHLVRALADPEWQVRAQAARALGRIDAVEAVPALAALLRDPAWWARRHAAYALAELGDSGRARLREVAASDPDGYARDIAAEALAGGFLRRRA